MYKSPVVLAAILGIFFMSVVQAGPAYSQASLFSRFSSGSSKTIPANPRTFQDFLDLSPRGLDTPVGAPPRLVFSDGGSIYTINFDGSELTRLTHGSSDSGASWSPDGTRIAFTRHATSTLELITGGGHSIGPVPTGDVRVMGQAIWSPSHTDSKLAFSGVAPDGRNGIYTVRPDGSDLRFIMAGGGQGLTFSPDGRRIAFICWVCQPVPHPNWPFAIDLFDIASDGSSAPRRLTSFPGGVQSFAYSPDGQSIALRGAFMTNIVEWLSASPSYLRPNPIVVGGLIVIRSDGSDAASLPPTAPIIYEGLPYSTTGINWSDDGDEIMFSPDTMGSIYKINRSGGTPINIFNLGRPATITNRALQWNVTNCAYSFVTPPAALNPFAPAGGGESIQVATNRKLCGWVVTSDASWITVSNNLGSYNGTATFHVLPNIGAPRQAILKFVTPSGGIHPNSPVIRQLGTGGLPTNVGGNVSVAGPNVNITFENVTQPGETYVTSLTPQQQEQFPPNFRLVVPSVAFEIETTATFTGRVTICFENLPDFGSVRFLSYRVLHKENGTWVNRTLFPDYANRRVCARISSFSPFVLAEEMPNDATPPVVIPQIVGTLSENGWYTSDVSVNWQVADNESAVTDLNGCGISQITTDTASTTLTCSATSEGGQTTNTVTIKRDATPPVITVGVPAEASAYLLNSSVTVQFQCDDGASGISTCMATETELNTHSVGLKSFTTSARDHAGNVTNVTRNYRVAYGIRVLSNMDRLHNAGSVVPIKVRLVDADGTNFSSSSVAVYAVRLMDVFGLISDVETAGNSNPNRLLRYDPEIDGYILNLKTSNLLPGTYSLTLMAGESEGLGQIMFRIR